MELFLNISWSLWSLVILLRASSVWWALNLSSPINLWNLKLKNVASTVHFQKKQKQLTDQIYGVVFRQKLETVRQHIAVACCFR